VTREILIDYDQVNDIDNSSLIRFIRREDHKRIVNRSAGEEHYRLLRYLSQQFTNGLIVELGTHYGTSALALSIDQKNKIITYDVSDGRFGCSLPDNVTRRLGNIFDLNEESILLQADFIFLDTSHTGDFEYRVYEYLRDNNYKNFIVYDDILQYEAMREFWNKIPDVSNNHSKHDITRMGHSSGTGLIDFGGHVRIKPPVEKNDEAEEETRSYSYIDEWLECGE